MACGPAGDVPLATPLHPTAAHALARARGARPGGLDMRGRLDGVRSGPAWPCAPPEIVSSQARKRLGAPAPYPSLSRRAADCSAVWPPAGASARNLAQPEGRGWWRLRRSCLAPSRRHPPGADPVPSPPRLRSPALATSGRFGAVIAAAFGDSEGVRARGP